MAAKKKAGRVGARAGKNPQGNIDTTFASNRRGSGGAKPKARSGGIVRKPVAKIRYRKSHD